MTTFLSKTIIIPTFGRPVLLKSCLDSIFGQVKEIEVIVIVNGVDEDTQKLLKNYPVIVITSKKVTPGEARNQGIKIAQGDIIGFLDDDIELCENYFTNLDACLKKYPLANVVGGPDQTFPLANNWEKVIGLTLMSPLATAKTSNRHCRSEIEVSNANEEYLILCNLWAKRDVFEKENFSFDHRFFRNEENILLFHLKAANKQLIYTPSFYVYHHRKSNLKSLFGAVSSSGFFRSLSFFYYPQQVSFHYMVPSLFVLYLISLIFFHQKILLLPMMVYIFLNVLISFRISLTNKSLMCFMGIIFTQFVINIAYGFGFLHGSFKMVFQSLMKLNMQIKRQRGKLG